MLEVKTKYFYLLLHLHKFSNLHQTGTFTDENSSVIWSDVLVFTQLIFILVIIIITMMMATICQAPVMCLVMC